MFCDFFQVLTEGNIIDKDSGNTKPYIKTIKNYFKNEIVF